MREEKSPVVVISGSPGLGERVHDPLQHHKVKDFQTQADVFHRLCGADAHLNDPNAAFRRINRVLDHVWRYKRPGYIELSRDLVHTVPDAPQATTVRPPTSVPAALDESYQLSPDAPLTIRHLIQRLNRSLDASIVVIADPGDALFASSDLVIHRQTEYIAPAYYTSMGFAVPAALGVMVARPDLRPIVLVGDGAFQMTGMVLSSAARYGFHPIVIVLDNKGFGTERCLHPGEFSFNDVQPWNYHLLPQLLGGGTGYEVHSEGDFDRALRQALADCSGFSLIHVHLGRNDASQRLERLSQRLAARVAGH